MLYKVEVATFNIIGKSNKRVPSSINIKNAIDKYIENHEGVIVYHETLYDYRYDLDGSGYHKINITKNFGNITECMVDDSDKVFIIINTLEPMNEDGNYICLYRANMQPNSVDRNLDITNLFAIDLINITDSELIDNLRLSKISKL